MRKFLSMAAALLLAISACSTFAEAASSTSTANPYLELPAPQTAGGVPLMQALNNRRTTRAFADKPLSSQQLSNLLWAGFGVNRQHGPSSKPGRTAPSARNAQEVELYVLLAGGTFVYDAVNNQLRLVSASDQRSNVGTGAAAHAAVTIVFVAPASASYAQVDTGFIGQNIYLYAASEGLNAWFYALHNQDVAKALNLGPDKTPLYGESVGFPEMQGAR